MSRVLSPSSCLDRRQLLLAGAATTVITSQPATAQEANGAASLLGDGAPFGRDRLLAHARELSRKPYAAPNAALPDGLRDLNFETYLNIKNRRERATWIDNPRGFILEPLHRGFIYQAPVALSVVENGLTRRLVYDPARFEFGKLQPPPVSAGDIGFSGFRVLSTVGEGAPREIALFQGASFIRAKARGQTFGSISRSLSLRTADPRGEEFPFFRAFWVEQPARDDTLIIHALLDSESVTGLFTFTIRVSDVTLIDTEAAIFPRVTLESYGIAGMQGTFLLGYTDRRIADDYRPQVADANGLQLQAGNGEWIWRPLSNPRTLQISAFSAEQPKGFGLVVRDRDFSAWQDVDSKFELRPTLWMEPIGDWGQGSLQLVEIPSENEIHDNIIAQWRPKEPLAAGGEYLFAYRQHFAWSPPDRPVLAVVTGTRTARAPQRRRRFLVDFTGDRLREINPAELTPALWASNNGIREVRLVAGDAARPTRVIFELDPGNETLVELRLALTRNNTPVSETWLYRWIP